MEPIILIGFGGHAKSVADCIERQGRFSIIGYTDHKAHASSYPYLGDDGILPEYFARGVCHAAICVGYMGAGSVRERLCRTLKEIGYRLPVIADPSAVISDSASLGEGVFVGKGAVINAEASVGTGAIINTGAVIEHECQVGDFSHVAVSAVLCGAVSLGHACMIGANATVLQALHLGDRTLVGAGSVVVRDISGGCTVAGNPARIIKYAVPSGQ